MFKKNPLIQFAGIPVSGAAIRSCFPNLASPEKKVQALEKSGESIRIKRDLFIVNQELTGKETDVRLCPTISTDLRMSPSNGHSATMT